MTTAMTTPFGKEMYKGAAVIWPMMKNARMVPAKTNAGTSQIRLQRQSDRSIRENPFTAQS